MAAMSTALTHFATNGDSRTWTTSGHTASKPKLVLQKRRVPSGNQTIAETTISVVHATTDVDGAVMAQKASFAVIVRYPIDGNATDTTNALAIFRDVVAGDEFGATVTSQNFLKP